MTEPNQPQSGTNLPAVITQDDASNRVTRAILDFITQIPDSKIHDNIDPVTNGLSPAEVKESLSVCHRLLFTLKG